MAQIFRQEEERERNRDSSGAAILILLSGFTGGMVGAASHIAILTWLLPMLGVNLTDDMELAGWLGCPVAWLASALFTMNQAMRWARKAD